MEIASVVVPTEVTKVIDINAPIDYVWKILTSEADIQQWMSEDTLQMNIDWRVGGDIIFQSNVNGKHEFKGKILELTPEKVFRYTSYSRITRQPDRDENYTVIEFKLLSPEVGKSQDKTVLTVTHSNLTAKASYEHSNFRTSNLNSITV